MNTLIFGLNFITRRYILRKKDPLLGALIPTEKCNLNCPFCKVTGFGEDDPDFIQIEKGLKELYGMGVRLLAITGGEPFCWSDDAHSLNDIIHLAKKTGFLFVAVYTNGTFPLHADADAYFVSLDGNKSDTGKLRGDIYDQVIENIESSKNQCIFINSVINSMNCKNIESFCKTATGIKNVRGISFYFHTPYYGKDKFYLDMESKRELIDEIFILRKKYPIINSKSCLRKVQRDSWKRPSDLCVVWEKGKIFECCRSNGNNLACENCGYMGYPELQCLVQLKLDSICTAYKYFS